MTDVVEGIEKYHDNGDGSWSEEVWIHGSDVSLGGGGSVTQGTTPWVDTLQAATMISATLQSAAIATGNGTDFTISGMAEARLTVTISGTATVSLTGTEDGSTFGAVSAEQPNAKPSSTISSSGLYSVHVAGLQKLRAGITSFTSGTVTVTGHATPIPAPAFLPKDASGNLSDSLATLIAGEDLTNNWQRVNTANAVEVTIQASAAKTSSIQSSLLAVGNYKEALFTLNCTAASGTSPSLTVAIQASDDGGTTWYPLVYPGTTTAVAFTALTAAGTQALSFVGAFGDTIRASSTISGTTPSFTYAVKAVLK